MTTKVTIIVITILVIATGLLTIAANINTQTPKPVERPFLCVIPYSLEYCHAHQDEMYRIQAERERGYGKS